MKKLILAIACIFYINILYAQQMLVPVDEGSKVHFVIKNFGIRTGGDFSGLKGSIRFNLVDISVWSFDVTVDAATVDTDNNSRDGHLRKPEYFDAEKFPVIRMVSTRVQPTANAGTYLFTGTLSIKGITKSVQFPFRVNKWGDGYLFTGEFGINRRDFGVGGSSVSLSDNLKISLSILAK